MIADESRSSPLCTLLRSIIASEQSSINHWLRGLKTENKQVQMDSRICSCLFAIQIREERDGAFLRPRLLVEKRKNGFLC